MHFKKIIFLFIIFVLNANSEIVKELHIGKTYFFAEKDFLVAIQERIKKMKPELEKKALKLSKEAKKQILNFKPKGIKPLTPAKKNSTRIIDMTYTLPFDIKDADGRILYPKGFKFNPAKYVHLRYSIIVINANNKKELNWLIKSKYFKNPIAYRICLTDGNWYEFIKKYKHMVYYCLPQIEKRFKLRHTISIVKQIGDKIVVKEISIQR